MNMEDQKQLLIKQLLNINDFVATLDDARKTITNLSLKLDPNYPIILVGGTNGKGSTCAYLTTILTHAGYKVGTFTSPHISEYNERISINNKPIDDKSLVSALEHIISHSECNLGLFKTFTLAAHYIFFQQQIDVAIVEVGLGGGLDVTNLFEPTISAITNVDFDHCEILGNTLEEIALEKAGIFRKNKWCFFGCSNIPYTAVDYANKIGAKLQIFATDFKIIRHDLCFDFLSHDRSFYSIPYPALRGFEQAKNASLAIAILNKLPQFPINSNIIKSALLQTKLNARFQLLPGLPQIILDVAHNPQAVSVMLKNMIKLPFTKNTYAVFGISKEKDADAIIEMCKNTFTKWFIAKINSSRGVSVKELTHILSQHNISTNNIIECDNIKSALNQALKISEKDDRVVCFGSFLVVDEASKASSIIK